MRRGVLLVVGKLRPEALDRLAAWWAAGQDGLLVVEAEDADARIVLVDIDGAVLGDTDAEGAGPVLMANARRSPEELRASVEAALRLGASGAAVGALLAAYADEPPGQP